MSTSLYPNRLVNTLSRAMLMLMLGSVGSNAQTPRWYVQHDFSPNVIKDMDSRDSLRCLVAIDSTLFEISKIIKSTDGGVTWRTVLLRYKPGGFIGRVTSVTWPSDSLAIATADSGRLLRSTDGGETWDDRALFDTNSTPYVRMIDSLHGFVFLDYVPEPRTFTTDDGGLTWASLPVPDPVGYDVRRWVWSETPRPARIGPSRVVCVKEGRGNFTESRLLVTSDRGNTWDTVRTPFPGWEAFAPWAFSMRFADSLVGWASMRRDGKWIVSRTTDGGFTWKVVSAELVTDLSVSPYIMWAGDSSRLMLGSSVKVRRSTDGGETWTDDSAAVSWNEHPDFAPPHPTTSWPVFGFNQFVWNKIHHFGIPSATTDVERSHDIRPGRSSDEGRWVADCRIRGSLLHVRFQTTINAPVSVSLHDVSGSLRYSCVANHVQRGESVFDIDAESLPAGIYALRIVSDGIVDARIFPILWR